MKSVRRSIALGTTSTLLAKGIGWITQILTAGYLARTLDIEALGIWSIFASLMTIAPCFDLGFGGPMLRNSLAKSSVGRAATRDHKIYLGTTKLLRWLYGGVAAVSAYSAFHFPWQSWFKIENVSLYQQLPLLFTGVAILLCMRMPYAMNADGFYAYHETHIRGLLDGFESLVSCLVTCLLVYLKSTFSILVMTYFAVGVALAWGAHRYFISRRRWIIEPISLREIYQMVRPQLNSSLGFWLLNALGLILAAQLPLIIGFVLGAKETGHFYFVYRLLTLCLGVHFAFINPLWTYFTQRSADHQWLKRTFWRMMLYTTGGYLVFAIVFYPLHEELITWWTGSALMTGPWVFALMVWVLLFLWQNALSVFHSSLGYTQIQLISLGAGLFVSLSACIMHKNPHTLFTIIDYQARGLGVAVGIQLYSVVRILYTHRSIQVGE